MEPSAFVGFSLDSALFSRELVRSALGYLLSEHEGVLFVLADQLLAYNKTASVSGLAGGVDLGSARAKMEQRRHDISRFVAKEIDLLPKADKQRVRVGTWNDYSDALYSDLHRKLRIAYSVVPEFRDCVDHDASGHFEKLSDGVAEGSVRHELSVSYVLDETAMDIRITEFGGYPFDYYPVEPIQTLTQLYEDRFRGRGLSVSGLIGKEPKRVFRPLRFAPNGLIV